MLAFAPLSWYSGALVAGGGLVTEGLEIGMDTLEDSYRIRLDQYEGPLDLLLHLIKKNEINIYDIPIALITKQYLDHITRMKRRGKIRALIWSAACWSTSSSRKRPMRWRAAGASGVKRSDGCR